MGKRVEFSVNNQKIVGTIFVPKGKGPFPGLVFFHGRGSNRQGYLPMAEEMANRLRIVTLTFDFRGCGESEGKLEEMTIKEGVLDGQTALVFLAQQKKVDKNRLGISGTSWGGAVAASIAWKNKNVRSLVLRVPSIYLPDWIALSQVPAQELDRLLEKPEQNFDSIRAIRNYKGALLIIYHQFDELIPKKAIDAYYTNAVVAEEKEWHMIKGASHSLSQSPPECREKTMKVTVDWFGRTLKVK